MVIAAMEDLKAKCTTGLTDAGDQHFKLIDMIIVFKELF